jgi:hypothetical protein
VATPALRRGCFFWTVRGVCRAARFDIEKFVNVMDKYAAWQGPERPGKLAIDVPD